MNENPLRSSLNSFKESEGYRSNTKPLDYGFRNQARPIRAIDIFQDGSDSRSQLSNGANQDRASKYTDIQANNLENLQKNSLTPNEYGLGSNRPINLESSIRPKQNFAKINYRTSKYEVSQTKKIFYKTNLQLDSSNNHEINNDPYEKRPSVGSTNNWPAEPKAMQSSPIKTNLSTKVNTFTETNPLKSYAERTLFDNTTRRSDSDDFLSNIAAAKPNSTIYLPRKTLKIGTIFINKPLKFLGYPDAFLEINECIIIDLSNCPEPNQKVSFFECNIHFKFCKRGATPNQSLSTRRSKESEELQHSEKKSYSDNTSGIQNHGSIDINYTGQIHGNGEKDDKVFSLFTLRQATTVELKDCEIKSLNFEKEMGFDVPYLNDCAFLLKHSKNALTHRESTTEPSLVLKNCRVTRFLTAIQNTFLCSIYIEKCSFIESRGHFINLSNPENFTIRESTMENSGKSCINVRFSKEISAQTQRRITIENNEFLKSNSYGISIFGENMIHQSCSVLIRSNLIVAAKRDGIGMKNLNITGIKIIKNTVIESHGNGVFLQNIIDGDTSGQVELRENKLSQSQLYGMTIMNTSVLSEKDEFVSNEKGGVIISAEDDVTTLEAYRMYKTSPLRCVFNSSHFNSNKDSGLIIVGCLKGPIILNSCEVYGNLNGIFIKLKQLVNFGAKSAGIDAKNSESHSLGHLLLDKCNIFQNKDSGLYLKSLYEKLFFRETQVQENKRYAVFLANEQEKNYLAIEKGKLKNFISGYVGGDWGLLFDQHERACKGTKCDIF